MSDHKRPEDDVTRDEDHDRVARPPAKPLGKPVHHRPQHIRAKDVPEEFALPMAVPQTPKPSPEAPEADAGQARELHVEEDEDFPAITRVLPK